MSKTWKEKKKTTVGLYERDKCAIDNNQYLEPLNYKDFFSSIVLVYHH